METDDQARESISEEQDQEPQETTVQAAVTEEEEADELERLRVELEAARKDAEEHLDRWRRTAAEFSNYRKRMEKEREALTQQANADLIARLLPVLDDLERAFATVPPSLLRLTWLQGLVLIHRKLLAVLEGAGVEPIETEGKAFDPREHEAVTYEAAEGFEDGQIIGEVQKGYRLGDQVLRPALVRVAQAPARREEEEEKEEKEEETVIEASAPAEEAEEGPERAED